MAGVYSTFSRPEAASAKKQSYEEILANYRATGELFEDPQFSPRDDDPETGWLRPKNLSLSPKFIADGVSRFDVKQGNLGDCWLIAAMANLTLNKELFDRVVPPGQTFEHGNYCGAFRFNFWQYGKWVEVIVDDRLPISRSNNCKYVHSSDHNEFWSPLLEKAYAKLYSSYSALKGGDFCEAMVDFTGGLAETLPIEAPPPRADLWKILKVCYERGSMMGCSIRNRIDYDPIGIYSGHAYGITMVAELHPEGNHSPLRMLRLRNPWGQKEWKGEWNDSSAKWFDISKEEKQRIGFTNCDDGEFWIQFDKWKTIFTHLEVCNMSPESVNNSATHRWFSQILEGDWSLQSGGRLTWSREFQFATNPQYLLELTEPDVDDPDGNCTLIVTLSQKERRQSSGGVGIGFYIYKAPEDQAIRLSGKFFKNNGPIIFEPQFSYDRDVTTRFHLPPGSYLIVPTTSDAGEGGEFMLRTWTEHEIKCVKLTGGDSAEPMTCSAAAPSAGVERFHQPIQVYAMPPAYDTSAVDGSSSGGGNAIRYPTLGQSSKPTTVREQPVAATRQKRDPKTDHDQPQTAASTYRHQPNSTTVVTTREESKGRARVTYDIINMSGRTTVSTAAEAKGGRLVITNAVIDNVGKTAQLTTTGKYKGGQFVVSSNKLDKGYIPRPAQRITDKNGVEKLIEETVIARCFAYPQAKQQTVTSNKKKKLGGFFRKFILCTQNN